MATRVAVILDSLHLGGTERHALRVLTALSPERYQSSIFALQDGPLRQVAAQGCIDVRVARPGRPVRRELEAFLEGWKPDVVHAQDRYTNPLAAAVRWLRPSARLLVSRRWSEGYGSARSMLGNWVAAHLAARIVANSSWSASAARRELLVGKDRVVVIPNFIEAALLEVPAGPPARASARAALGLPHDAFVVVAVGNLRPVKGHDVLIRALASVSGRRPPIHLVIVGEGEARATLEALASQLGVADRVHLVGHAQPAQWQLAADLCALGSWSESSPNALLEAMALSRPVLATEVGGIPSLVQKDRTGWLVPPGDVRAFGAHLVELVNSPDRLAAAGREGRRVAGAAFSEGAVMPLWELLYAGTG